MQATNDTAIKYTFTWVHDGKKLEINTYYNLSTKEVSISATYSIDSMNLKVNNSTVTADGQVFKADKKMKDVIKILRLALAQKMDDNIVNFASISLVRAVMKSIRGRYAMIGIALHHVPMYHLL